MYKERRSGGSVIMNKSHTSIKWVPKVIANHCYGTKCFRKFFAFTELLLLFYFIDLVLKSLHALTFFFKEIQYISNIGNGILSYHIPPNVFWQAYNHFTLMSFGLGGISVELISLWRHHDKIQTHKGPTLNLLTYSNFPESSYYVSLIWKTKFHRRHWVGGNV